MRTIDYLVVAVYLIAVFAVGIAFRGRKRNVEEYFTAHGTFRGKLGSLIIGLSIAASFFSGISFIVYSSFSYGNGLQIVMCLVGIPAGWLILRYWFFDRYLSAGVRHPYDIVESRLGYPARSCLSVMFVLLRISWMAVIIYAPTLIIMGALGLGESWFWPIVLTVGGTCTVVSVVGGIRGVIVTDAIQFSVIALGLALVIVLVLARLHWDMAGIGTDLARSGHLRLFDFTLSFTAPWTVWAIVIGSIVSSASQYLSDQMALQRYLASESRAAVQHSFTINMIGAVAVCGLLVSVGLLLSVWYLRHANSALPQNPDQVLPFFAARELPAGMSGLLIAAILAATMNTLTSGINSLAGAITNDFIARMGKPHTPAGLFRAARLTSFALGAVATLSAGFASRLGTVLQSSNIMTGAFQGPMLACMVWAVSGAAVRARAVLLGMLVGTLAGGWVAFTAASSFWVAPAGFFAGMLIPVIDSAARRLAAASRPDESASTES